MLVDGGPSGVYEATLRARLVGLHRADVREVATLDIVCITHVDDDHIVGVLRLLTELDRARRDELPLPIRVARLWHNSFDALLDTVSPGLAASASLLLQDLPGDDAVAASFGQGEHVRRLASSLGLCGNSPFNGPIVCGASQTVDGLDITVVAPDRRGLEALADKWKAATSGRDPSVIAAAYNDRSVPNLSSIALHVRAEGHTALLAGDARGDHLLHGLQVAGLAGPDEPLHVGLLKLPHHGSANNAAPSLFQRVRADHYVISADGGKHHHPNEATLRWLVESRDPADDYVVHLTNPVPFALEQLRELQRDRRFQINLRAPAEPSVVIRLADG
jgi:hypothetical protein